MSEKSPDDGRFSASDIEEWSALGPPLRRAPQTPEELERAKTRKALKNKLASQLGWTTKQVETTLDKLVQESNEAYRHDWASIFPRYPTTPDGYVRSYAVDEPNEYIPVLKKYGVVVIKALPDNLCDETVQALQDEVNRQQQDCATCPVQLEDSTTWNNENWPSDSKYLFGNPTVCPAAWKVRLHPNIQRIFSEIYETSHLVSSIDNWLLARGTRNVKVLNNETGETETREHVSEWEQSLPLHVHLDPWSYRDKQAACRDDGNDEYTHSIMAVVSLVDCPKPMGGHVTVPGSAPFLDTWADENLDKKPKTSHRSYYGDDERRATMMSDHDHNNTPSTTTAPSAASPWPSGGVIGYYWKRTPDADPVLSPPHIPAHEFFASSSSSMTRERRTYSLLPIIFCQISKNL